MGDILLSPTTRIYPILFVVNHDFFRNSLVRVSQAYIYPPFFSLGTLNQKKTEITIRGAEALSDPYFVKTLQYFIDMHGFDIEVTSYRCVTVIGNKRELDCDMIRSFERNGFKVTHILPLCDFGVEVTFERPL